MTRFGKISPLGKNLKLWEFFRVYLVFGKIWTCFGNDFCQSSQFSLLPVSNYLKNNLAIWTHWTMYLPTYLSMHFFQLSFKFKSVSRSLAAIRLEKFKEVLRCRAFAIAFAVVVIVIIVIIYCYSSIWGHCGRQWDQIWSNFAALAKISDFG